MPLPMSTAFPWKRTSRPSSEDGARSRLPFHGGQPHACHYVREARLPVQAGKTRIDGQGHQLHFVLVQRRMQVCQRFRLPPQQRRGFGHGIRRQTVFGTERLLRLERAFEQAAGAAIRLSLLGRRLRRQAVHIVGQLGPQFGLGQVLGGRAADQVNLRQVGVRLLERRIVRGHLCERRDGFGAPARAVENESSVGQDGDGVRIELAGAGDLREGSLKPPEGQQRVRIPMVSGGVFRIELDSPLEFTLGGGEVPRSENDANASELCASAKPPSSSTARRAAARDRLNAWLEGIKENSRSRLYVSAKPAYALA